MDIKAILELLRFVSKSDLTEVIVEEGEFRLTIRRGLSGAAPTAVITPVAPPTAAPLSLAFSAGTHPPRPRQRPPPQNPLRKKSQLPLKKWSTFVRRW